jgi:hypothetical protein
VAQARLYQPLGGIRGKGRGCARGEVSRGECALKVTGPQELGQQVRIAGTGVADEVAAGEYLCDRGAYGARGGGQGGAGPLVGAERLKGALEVFA